MPDTNEPLWLYREPTKEEQAAMLQLHAELLVEEISKQISKP
jgi:hypothetical protein